MTTADSSMLSRFAANRLDTVLRANAAVSGASALVVLLFSEGIASWLDVPRVVLVASGLGLAVFAGFVGWVAVRNPLPPRPVGLIALADFGWVMGAAAILLIPGALPVGGKVGLALVSLVVLDLGVLEWMGFRRMPGSSKSGGSRQLVDDSGSELQQRLRVDFDLDGP